MTITATTSTTEATAATAMTGRSNRNRLLRRWLAPFFAASMLLTFAAPAQAQLVVTSGESLRSPQNFALEFRLGPYQPNVDAEFKGTKTPHRDYFGKGTRLMFQVELDWQVYRALGVGAIGVGLSAGYFYETARSPFGVNDKADATRSGDKSRFSLYPLAALLVYRADQAYRSLNIPLVPYGKLGLNYTIWNVYDGNDRIATDPKGGRGRGGTFGWQAAAGLSLVMDVVDPGAARALDGETGINHTHLFIELARYSVSGLGQKQRLNVGDTTWSAGLMFEF